MRNFSMETYLKQLETLVNIDSGMGNPDGATQTGLMLAEMLVEKGWLLERHKVSDQCGECMVLKNREADRYDVLMVGHTDTVFPAGEALKRPFRRDEKRAYGVGVLDMKQGCLAMVYILNTLPQEVLDKLNIVVVFNPDEEIGSPYTKELTDSYARRTEYGMVFEAASTDGPHTIQRKGMMRLTMEFLGKAGHAGYAFDNGGISAVYEMSYWITQLISRFHNAETGTSINAGVVSGGQAVNIIPDQAEVQFDIRYEKISEMEKVEACIEELTAHAEAAGVRLVTKKRSKSAPMEPTEKTYALCELAKEVCAEIGQTFATKKRGGLSDANHISACGCTTIDGLGPTGDFDHSEDEYLELSTIEPTMDFVYGLLCKIAQQK